MMQAMEENKIRGQNKVAQFLDLFYPIHYTLGMALEAALRMNILNRKQVAILWLIRYQSDDGRSMRRKQVQRLLREWFEVSSPSISKALRSMSAPPLSLISIREDSQSAREKRVVLTTKGVQFLEAMTEQGQAFLSPIIKELAPEEANEGLRFLQRVTAILERSLRENRRARRGASARSRSSVGKRPNAPFPS